MLRKIKLVITILYNLFRLPLTNIIYLGALKFSKVVLISPFASISSSNKGRIEIGYKCGIESGTLIRANEGELKLGSNVYINRNCNIVAYDSIEVGAGTTIGPSVNIYDHNHTFVSTDKKYETERIIIGNNVWIGANSCILKGVKIGNNSIVGAGSVVTKSIPENVMYAGNPAKLLKQLPRSAKNEEKSGYSHSFDK
ncbi:acyltransferase [Exiguobacterium alkaliphilum]|uniref:acyltransferase n=1 Tax=Exiguobacterium alkaliphilum TaxID=1428684 RepID=UPI001BAA5E56|nr:acyltransferase [Exiguobacterium alkaliphilum]QUE87197.1 acyltransferase [Exiguobacterium alkaliphilum]